MKNLFNKYREIIMYLVFGVLTTVVGFGTYFLIMAGAEHLLDIPMENAMALGDSGNDESILRAAGLGIAMGNAPDFIKSAADAVTETNDNDGAAIAIERYCL